MSSDEKILPTTYGELRPPLGKHRLKVGLFIYYELNMQEKFEPNHKFELEWSKRTESAVIYSKARIAFRIQFKKLVCARLIILMSFGHLILFLFLNTLLFVPDCGVPCGTIENGQ